MQGLTPLNYLSVQSLRPSLWGLWNSNIAHVTEVPGSVECLGAPDTLPDWLHPLYPQLCVCPHCQHCPSSCHSTLVLSADPDCHYCVSF